MNKMKFKYDFSSMKKAVKDQKENKFKNNFKDVRFYYPQAKEDGTAEAIIRFLPPKIVDDKLLYDIPYVDTKKHSFKDIGGWFIDECPRTIGQKCPVCEDINPYWKSEDKAVKKIAETRGKKTEYIANIYIVKDVVNPENNGKVFLFKFGKKIYEKIMDKWMPAEDSVDYDSAVDIWDYENGANFKLKIKRTAKGADGKSHPDYSTSEFMAPSALQDDLERVNTDMFDLNEFVDPKRFKSYEVLLEKYKKVVGEGSAPVTNASESTSDDSESESEESSDPVVVDEEEETSKSDFFKKLREDSNKK